MEREISLSKPAFLPTGKSYTTLARVRTKFSHQQRPNQNTGLTMPVWKKFPKPYDANSAIFTMPKKYVTLAELK
jgi:hypothetical protein